MANSPAKPAGRLKKRPQFLRVAKGAKVAMPGLVLQARRRSDVPGAFIDSDATACRVGFTATKKVGNAVVRNRTKRRLRAAAAALLPHYGRPDYDYVLVGRMTTPARKFDALCDDLQKALMRVHQEPKAVNKNK